MNFIVSAATDIGLTRKTNQDSYCVQVYTTAIGKVVLAVLCDGMGGLSKGEVASGSLAQAFGRWAGERLPQLCEKGIEDADIRREWEEITTEYNEKIKSYAASCGTNMGTTVTAMLLTSDRYYILNVGDSRAYEIAEEAKVLTKDQTVVAREMEMGYLTEEQARKDSRRSVLLQCVGASPEVNPDLFFGTTRQNAVYMLCSDGFRHEITPQEIHQYLNPDVMMDADGMQQNMVSLIELNKQRQETDNITVVTVRTF